MSDGHLAFMAVSRSRYLSMQARFKAKFDRRGRLTRPELPLPFTVEEFRTWLRDLLGGEQGEVRCEYCRRKIPVASVELDHRMPVSRGGDLGLKNLAVVCGPCNQRKGAMSAPAFLQLLDFLGKTNWDYRDTDDLLGR